MYSTGRSCKQYLIEDEDNPESANDFGKNIIPAHAGRGQSTWWLIPSRATGRTSAPSRAFGRPTWICSQSPPAFNLYDSSLAHLRPQPHAAPALHRRRLPRFPTPWSPKAARLPARSITAILFSGATVEEGAVVENSVIMNGAHVRKGARIRRAIVAENAVVGCDSVVGGNGRIAVVGQRCRAAGVFRGQARRTD